MVRSTVAALTALVVVIAGASAVAGLHARSFSDVAALVSQQDAAPMAATVLGWGFALFALLAVFAAAAAFKSEESDPFRASAPPKGAPMALALLSFALLWAAFLFSGDSAGDVMTADASASPPLTEQIPAPGPALAQAPRAVGAALPYRWPYQEPRLGAGAPASVAPSPSRLFGGEAAARGQLCGKAWIALAGAASEEGPRARNDARARLRARLAADQAWDFLADARCGRPVILIVDLGQHVGTAAADPDATAYQRQALIVARDAGAGEALSQDRALEEARAFFASPDAAALLGARRYHRAPQIEIFGGSLTRAAG